MIIKEHFMNIFGLFSEVIIYSCLIYGFVDCK